LRIHRVGIGAVKRQEVCLSHIPLMKENRISIFGRSLVCVMLAIIFFLALRNLAAGKVIQPKGLFISLAGFVLFAISKLRVIARKKMISFGPKFMNEGGVNLYRVGYWLMAVGVLVVFLG
jgi:hypothetical protein